MIPPPVASPKATFGQTAEGAALRQAPRGGMSATAQATRAIAVMGTGSAGMRHLEALEALRQSLHVEAVAVPRRPGRAAELAGRYATVTRLEETRSRGVGAAIIATDTGRHLEDGLAALAFGLDVLIEKPLAGNAAEAARLRDVAAQQGRKLFVGCLLRFSESLEQFRRWLPAIGRVHSVRVACQSYLPDWRPHHPYRFSYSARGQEGGVLRDLIHDIDYAGWIFGWPTSLQARLVNTGTLGIEAEEAAELLWDTVDGAAVSIRLDYLTRPAQRVMLACGADGTLEWDGVRGRTALTRVGEPAKEFQAVPGHGGLFAAQAKAFSQALGGAFDERLATGAEGVLALAVCDAARQASRDRREVAVGYP